MEVAVWEDGTTYKCPHITNGELAATKSGCKGDGRQSKQPELWRGSDKHDNLIIARPYQRQEVRYIAIWRYVKNGSVRDRRHLSAMRLLHPEMEDNAKKFMIEAAKNACNDVWDKAKLEEEKQKHIDNEIKRMAALGVTVVRSERHNKPGKNALQKKPAAKEKGKAPMKGRRLKKEGAEGSDQEEAQAAQWGAGEEVAAERSWR